ncbi:MAG: glycosyltransferase [Holophagales bacterium]|nr:glycosyltransferase [Holophagales bacterium]
MNGSPAAPDSPGPMKTLLFGNVTQRPYQNNLLPAVRALERSGPTKVVEPRFIEGFVPTGAARPALIPRAAVEEALASFQPDLVVCLAGGLYLARESRQLFPGATVFAGLALSDPLGLDASLDIAPEFDLYYTQDPQTLPSYVERGIAARRCDPATDPELYRPLGLPPEDDILFLGKWTPHRDEVVRRLSQLFRVAVHAHAGDSRWTIPARPPLESPPELCAGINRARLMLEFAVLDDAEGRFRGTSRMTNRPQFAAACGVPTLIDPFEHLSDFFEPGIEIEVYRSVEELTERAAALLADEPRRHEMGRRARARVLREQTWDHRVDMLRRDVGEFRLTTTLEHP